MASDNRVRVLIELGIDPGSASDAIDQLDKMGAKTDQATKHISGLRQGVRGAAELLNQLGVGGASEMIRIGLQASETSSIVGQVTGRGKEFLAQLQGLPFPEMLAQVKVLGASMLSMLAPVIAIAAPIIAVITAVNAWNSAMDKAKKAIEEEIAKEEELQKARRSLSSKDAESKIKEMEQDIADKKAIRDKLINEAVEAFSGKDFVKGFAKQDAVAKENEALKGMESNLETFREELKKGGFGAKDATDAIQKELEWQQKYVDYLTKTSSKAIEEEIASLKRSNEAKQMVMDAEASRIAKALGQEERLAGMGSQLYIARLAEESSKLNPVMKAQIDELIKVRDAVTETNSKLVEMRDVLGTVKLRELGEQGKKMFEDLGKGLQNIFEASKQKSEQETKGRVADLVRGIVGTIESGVKAGEKGVAELKAKVAQAEETRHKLVDAFIGYQKQVRDADKQYETEKAGLAKRQQAQTAALDKREASERAEQAKAEKDLATRFNAEKAKSEKQFSEGQQKALRDHLQSEAQIVERAQMEQQNRLLQHELKLNDLAAARDVSGFIQEQKSFELGNKQKETQDAQDKADREKQYAQQQADAEQAFAEQQAERESQYHDELMALQEQSQAKQQALAEERALQKQKDQEDLAALDAKHQDELDKLKTAFAEQIAELDDHLGGLHKLRQQYYDSEAAQFSDWVNQNQAEMRRLLATSEGQGYENTPQSFLTEPQQESRLASRLMDEGRGFAGGLASVPYDNYVAVLHQGEQVVKAGSGGVNVTLTGPLNVGAIATPEDIAIATKGIIQEIKTALESL